MKTISIMFLAIVVVSGILISIGAMSGYLNLGIEFGLKDDTTNTETEISGSRILEKEFDDEPEIDAELQILSQESTLYLSELFRFKTTRFPYIFASIENPYLDHATIDLDNLTAPYNPPGVYHPPDDPIFLVDDDYNMLENYSMPIVDPDVISGTGFIQYVTNDEVHGNFYGIVSDDGEQYQPSNLPSEFEIDGLSVRFKVRTPEIQNLILYTWGIPVDILEIEVSS